MFDLFIENLSSPPILFFALGLAAGLVKSDLSVPDQISRYLSLYLMMAIGFKGGVAIAQTPEIDSEIVLTILAGVGVGALQPFVGYALLRRTTALDRPTAAAAAAHYGSISMVTFVTAASFLDAHDVIYAGYIVAVLALMEAPAILSGLYLARRGGKKEQGTPHSKDDKLLRDILTNGAILLLTGSFVIGWISGGSGMDKMEGFLVTPFQGILALFLLDMGLLVSRQLTSLRDFTPALLAFGIYMPLLGAALGLGLAVLIGLDRGTGMLFTVLVASASYIAVPAAMRLALPEARASVYVPMALGITFPFNIVIGIPLYYTLAGKFLG